jgi:hypothetical protein
MSTTRTSDDLSMRPRLIHTSDELTFGPAICRPYEPRRPPRCEQKPNVKFEDELSFSPGDSVEAILMKLMMRMTKRLDGAIRAQAKWADTLSKHEQEVAAEESAAARAKPPRDPKEIPNPAPKKEGSFMPAGDSSSTAIFQLQQLSKLRETTFSAMSGAIDAYSNSAKRMADKVGQ